MKREIREETGITDIRIEGVAYVTLVNGNHPYLIIAYLCETLTDAVELSNEHQAYVWADKEMCKELQNYFKRQFILKQKKEYIFENEKI